MVEDVIALGSDVDNSPKSFSLSRSGPIHIANRGGSFAGHGEGQTQYSFECHCCFSVKENHGRENIGGHVAILLLEFARSW